MLEEKCLDLSYFGNMNMLYISLPPMNAPINVNIVLYRLKAFIRGKGKKCMGFCIPEIIKHKSLLFFIKSVLKFHMKLYISLPNKY